MANLLKKLAAGISAAAVMASLIPTTIALADATVYYNEDFSGFAAGTLVNLATTSNNTYEDQGFKFSCGGRSSDVGQLGINAENGYLKLFAWKYNDNGARKPTITLTKSSGVTYDNGMLIRLDTNIKDTGALIFTDSAGTEYTYKTEHTNKWLTVTIAKTADVMYVDTVDRDTGNMLSFEKVEVPITDLASIRIADLSSATNEAYIDNFYVADEAYTLPAALHGALTAVDGALDPAEDYMIEYDGSEEYQLTPSVKCGDSEVGSMMPVVTCTSDSDLISYADGKIHVSSNVEEETEYHLTFDVAVDGTDIVTTYTVIVYVPQLTPEQVLQNAYNSLSIPDSSAVSYNDEADNYTVYGEFELPTLTGKASVKEWTITDDMGAATQYAWIEDGKVKFDTDTSPMELYFTLTATIEYSGETREKAFTLYAPDLTTVINYKLDFEDFKEGSIVSLTNGTDDTTYADKGLTFEVGTRDGGEPTDLSVQIVKEENNKVMLFQSTNYADKRTPPTMKLTNSNKAKKNLFVIEADMKFSKVDTILRLSDVLDIMVPSEEYIDKWLHYSISNNKKGAMDIVVTDMDGNVVLYYQKDTTISEVKQMLVPASNGGKVYVDNLNILDQAYVLSDEDVVDGGVNNLDIETFDMYPISSKDEKYTARDDFALPNAPAGTTIAWQSDNDALKISADGSKAVINPELKTDTDVIVTAELTKGNVTKTKDFSVKVLTPASVINEVKDATNLVIDNKTINANAEGKYVVSKDLTLDPGDYVKISWASDTGKITSAGAVMPKADDNDTVLTATYSYKGVKDTKPFTVVLPNAKTAYIDPTVAALQVTSADDEKITKPVTDIGTVDYDIKLPTSVKVETGTVKIDWKIESDAAKLVGDVVEYTVADRDAHTVKLTPTYSYVKNGTELYKESGTESVYKVQFTDTTADKYKVRMDAAYADNFKDIPSSTTSNITLPKKGHFGSTFTWNSSNISAISNQGTVTRLRYSDDVILKALIEAGSSNAEITRTVSVPGTGGGSGGSGGGGGGGGRGGAPIANPVIKPSVVTNESGQEIVDRLQEEKEQANDKFVDVKDAAWARIAINTLAEKGIVNGVSDTEFAPNDTVTRAQFAKMLMGVFGLTASSFSTSSFNDVSTDAWYFDAVETAYNLGILQGVEEGRFDPDALITRQDMAVMVTRAANAAGKTLSPVTESIAFDDAANIADYAEASVDTLVKAGIINGMSDTEFAPLDNATRAQAAKILYGLL